MKLVWPRVVAVTVLFTAEKLKSWTDENWRAMVYAGTPGRVKMLL